SEWFGFAVSPDRTLIALSSYSSSEIWTSAGRRVRTIPGTVTSFNGDGTLVLTSDGVLYKTATGQFVTWLGADRWVSATPGIGAIIASGASDGTVRIYRCGVCRPIEAVLAAARHRLAAGAGKS